MSGWAVTHPEVISQVYGLAFFVLGVVAYVLPRQDTALRFARDLWLLAAFGMLHGVLEFVDRERLHNPAPWLAALGSLLLVASCLPLLEFGRRALAQSSIRTHPAWLYGMTGLGTLAWMLAATDPLAGLAVGARYFIGLPGALFAGFALFVLLRSQPAHAGPGDGYTAWLGVLAAAFLGYGALTPFVPPDEAALPAWLPTTANFLAATGVPIQLLRALCAVAATLSLIALARQAGARNSEDLQRMLGTIKGFVYRCNNDPDWSLVYLSGNVAELCGYTADEFLVRRSVTLGGLIHPDDAPRVWDEVQKALGEQRDFELSYRLRTRHRGLRWVYERGRGIFDAGGRLRFLEGFISDATALIQANESLRIKDAAIESSINAIAMTGLDGRISYVNPAFVRLWRLNGPQDVLGRSLPDLWDSPRAARAAAEALRRHGSWQGPLRARRSDHAPMELQLSASTVFDEAGTPVCVMNSFADLSERVQAEKATRNAQRQLQAVIDAATQVAIIATDADGHISLFNKGAEQMLGYRAEDMVGKHTLTHLHDATEIAARAETLSRKYGQSLHGKDVFLEPARRGDPTPREWTYVRSDGVRLTVNLGVTPLRDENERITGFLGIATDITERKLTEMALASSLEELRASEQRQLELLTLTQREQGRMAALLSGMSIGILFEDRDGQVEYVNPAFRHMWAIREDIELVGRPTQEVLNHSTHRFARPDHASRHILHVLDTHEISERFEIDLYDGRILTQLSYPVADPDGRVIGRLWIYEDITHERQTAQQLIYLAEHDALTGLHNRHRFQDHLERMISASTRSGARFALLYFDLDEFKSINDSFGHRAGDTVLVRAAGEVASLVRGGEMFARLGGDEFAILVDVKHGDEPAQLAERVVHAISAIPFRFRGSNIRLTASIGIALFPEHGENAEDLVAHADTAMYQAKDSGKNTWAVYDASRNIAEAMLERMTWSTRIAQALERGGLELHFQGIYHTRDGSLSHLEALVRMHDPLAADRLVMPGQFIPVAEKNGQILEIDRWVIRQSIATLARHPELAALAVNVSGRSFDEPSLPRYIHMQLEQHDVAPKRLIIELTETAAVSEMQDAQRFIEALQQTGCLICLDDFGSGFSTFAYLKYLGVQILKIDGMFIRDLPNNRDNQAFVKAMIDVARGLGKVTVAEFVEDAATLDMLRSFGVDMAQGYHLDRPSARHPSLD